MTRSVTRKYGITIANINLEQQPKRRHDNINTAPNKRVKIEFAEELKAMTIMDVNNDCLGHILDYLELGDLLNVAETSKLLLPVACTAYKRKYGKKCVSVSVSGWKTAPKFEFDGDRIMMTNFSIRLKILRCFGPWISELDIQYWPGKRDLQAQAMLDHYISVYCAASKIKIYDYSKKATMPNFSKCFSKVQWLELVDCDTSSLSHTAAHLSQLKHLTVWNNNKLFNTKIPTNFIYSNPQLKRLKIQCNVDLNLLRVISEHLEELESLDVTIESWTDSNTAKDTIRFKNVKSLRFGLFCLTAMPKISMSFDQLEEFTFAAAYGYYDVPEGLYTFISKHPRITRFKCVENRWNPIVANEITKLLPSLEEFDLRAMIFDVNEAIGLLKQSPQLKSFQFELWGEYKLLQQRLNEGWRSTIDEAGLVKLERKMENRSE